MATESPCAALSAAPCDGSSTTTSRAARRRARCRRVAIKYALTISTEQSHTTLQHPASVHASKRPIVGERPTHLIPTTSRLETYDVPARREDVLGATQCLGAEGLATPERVPTDVVVHDDAGVEYIRKSDLVLNGQGAVTKQVPLEKIGNSEHIPESQCERGVQTEDAGDNTKSAVAQAQGSAIASDVRRSSKEENCESVTYTQEELTEALQQISEIITAKMNVTHERGMMKLAQRLKDDFSHQADKLLQRIQHLEMENSLLNEELVMRTRA